MAEKARERGRDIHEAKAKQGHCAACEPTPKGRVSAGEIWARAMAAPGGYGVRISR